jgi:AmmeMemoRadiSam system protein B
VNTLPRPPVVAGSFYPAGRAGLAATVDALLDAAPPPGQWPRPVGLVVPHAAYVYSGPVAAAGYAQLVRPVTGIGRVVVLGPSHFVDLEGLAVPTADALATPLGAARVDTAATASLVEAGLARAADAPHASEHAIEVQLPFLLRILPEQASFVAVAVGRAEAGRVADLIDHLDAGLVVVSTDLSHYLTQEDAREVDFRTASAVVAREPQRIDALDACGVHALRGLLTWALRHDHRVELLDLRTSADTAGRPERVVGYGAFAVRAS